MIKKAILLLVLLSLAFALTIEEFEECEEIHNDKDDADYCVPFSSNDK